MITVCAFSDGHGLLPKIEKPFDLLLIGGDNIDLNYQNSSFKTKAWYLSTFVDWVNALPFKDLYSKVIFIAGNHEVGLQKLAEEELNLFINELKINTNDRVVYLQNESYKFWKESESVLIFGTPYCRIFGRWAYMEDDEHLQKLYAKIPENCDILLTHDAPYGTSDICYGWQAWGEQLEHIGNKALSEAIVAKSPKYNIHGHLHSANHNFETLNNTLVSCVSLVDEDYIYAYEPLYLEL